MICAMYIARHCFIFNDFQFISYALNKAKAARSQIDKAGLDVRLEIDRGGEIDNMGQIAQLALARLSLVQPYLSAMIIRLRSLK